MKKINEELDIPYYIFEEIVEYIEQTKILDIVKDDYKKASLKSNTRLRKGADKKSPFVEKLKKGDTVYFYENEQNGYTKIKTSNGYIGFVPTNLLENIEDINIQNNYENDYVAKAPWTASNGKINLVFDQMQNVVANSSESRRTYHDGVDVLVPTWFSFKDESGQIVNIADKGYVNWAHSNGYEVWSMFSNDSLQQLTSQILNDYEARENLILNIVQKAKQYNLDGINIDFENMYMEDADVFSRFIIELEPRLKILGKTLSVDVTAPDGAESWSMCYDRNVIGDVADYIVFMAYDQYGEASTEPGTTSGYEWVKVNLDKFVETEEIEPEKIILGLPFYTRVWTTQNGNLVRTDVVAMKNVDGNIPTGVEKVWDEVTRQNYIKYDSNGYTREMWIEDIDSYKEKLLLINEYGLGGVANWCKDMEPEEIWSVINENL